MGKGLLALHESDETLDIHQFDLVIASPGVPPSNPFYSSAQKAGIDLIGEIELACRFISQPVLAVTGTNGKTTTTLLIAHVLNHNGKKACALGNVGTPLISELENTNLQDTILVVELSSYQLETLQAKVIDAGVILNITPDHLDRYSDMQSYAAAKIHLKDCLKPQKNLYVFEDTYNEYKDLFQGFMPLTYGYTPSCSFYTDKEKVYHANHVEIFFAF